MEKKKYISPAITVYESTPCVILAGSPIYKATDEDYNSLEGVRFSAIDSSPLSSFVSSVSE